MHRAQHKFRAADASMLGRAMLVFEETGGTVGAIDRGMRKEPNL
tara:strand:- start:599 stop:730 length:132 start_codon:yes stop_codon:yes gene_type:complete